MKKIILVFISLFLIGLTFAYTLDSYTQGKLNGFSKKMEKNIKSNTGYISKYKNEISILESKYKGNTKAISILEYLSGKVYEYDRLMFRYNDVKMEHPDVDLDSFEQIGDLYLGGGYNKDKKNVFYNNMLLKGANPSTFQLLTGDFSKDDKNVYYGGWKIDLDPNTLQVLTGGFAKDDKNVYWAYVQITGADALTFEVTSNAHGKDKNKSYYGQDYNNYP